MVEESWKTFKTQQNLLQKSRSKNNILEFSKYEYLESFQEKFPQQTGAESFKSLDFCAD